MERRGHMLISIRDRLAVASNVRRPVSRNAYDWKGRRVRKTTPEATYTFFYDGWNLVEERVTYTNGATSTIHYYWGKDLSGTLQGAGNAPVAKRSGCLSEANPEGRKGPRVGGLLYLTIDDAPFVPCYDANGNVTRYLDASGRTVAQYVYAAFGNLLSQSGSLADAFRFSFSTKYLDTETGLYYYGHRFYSPALMRWLTRDPIGELGGLNLYGFCGNNAVEAVDYAGFLRVVFHRIGESPRNGWGHPDNIGVISVVFKLPQVVAVRCDGRKQGYRVSFTPRESRADIYLHESLSIRTIKDELEHVQCAREYDKELDSFKNAVEAICDCSETAESLYRKAADRLKKAEMECEQCNARLDAPGGPHGH